MKPLSQAKPVIRPARVPPAAIRRLVRQIAERFQPERIILFGSYAYGRPHRDSDVDLLVVMPAKHEIRQAVRIRQNTDHPFPLDLIVRTPEKLKQRLEWGDWFLREIIERGKVMYEKHDAYPGSDADSTGVTAKN